MFFFIFHRSEQRCDTYFTKPVLLCLTGKSSGPSILSQMTNLRSSLWLNDNALCIIYPILFTYTPLNGHLKRVYPVVTVTVGDDCRHACSCLPYWGVVASSMRMDHMVVLHSVAIVVVLTKLHVDFHSGWTVVLFRIIYNPHRIIYNSPSNSEIWYEMFSSKVLFQSLCRSLYHTSPNLCHCGKVLLTFGNVVL